MMRARQAGWCSVAIGFATVLAIGCGDDIPPDGTVLPEVTFNCRGTVTDPAGNQVPTNVTGVPPLNTCLPQSATPEEKDAKCESICDNGRAAYATVLNNMNGTNVMMGQLNCEIEQVVQIADDCIEGAQSPLTALPVNGGPAAYVANLTGSLNFSVSVDTPVGAVGASANPATSGQLGYTIIPLDRNCPSEGGCQLLITSLTANVANFDLSASVLGVPVFSHSITNMSIQNNGWVTGAWFPDGHFVISEETGLLAITLRDNGTRNSVARLNTTGITGTINPVTGAVSFDPFSQTDGSTTVTLTTFSGTNVVTPPDAVISAPGATVECNQTNAAATTLDASASTAGIGAPIFSYAWSVNGGAPITGPVVPAILNLGPNTVALNVFSQTLGVDTAERAVTVVDTTPPTFGPLAAVTSTVCDPSSQGAAIATPTATDICSPTVAVTGAIIASNGATLATPIPIQNGQVTVPAGTHTVRWTATDQSGRTSTATQTLNVRAGVQSSNSFVVADRAQLRVPGGGFAMLGNRGAGAVNVGVQSHTGALSAGGNVTLRDRSTVHGNLRATGDLIRQNLTTVTGTILTHVPSNLPPGMDLTGVVFPPTNSGNITVPVGGTQTLAPGSYAAVTVFASGRLTLTAGTYFMNSLDLEPQSRLILNQSAGAVRIFVRNSIIDRGQIAPTTGAPGQFFLGYAGTAAFSIETPFLAGTIVAPNAKVTVTSLGTGAFSGQLFARDIEVQPDAFLTCDPVGRTAQQAGL